MNELIDMLRKASLMADDGGESQRYEEAADALELQAREIERLKTALDDAANWDTKQLQVVHGLHETIAKLRTELAALKAQPSEVVLPERSELNNGDNDIEDAWKRGRNHGLKEVARLNQPASGGDDAGRAAFEAVRDCKGFEFFDNCYWLRAIPECPDEKALINADWELWQTACKYARATLPVRQPLRYTFDGELAECPCCGSLDVGGAHDTVNCYGCGLQITKPRPLQNAADAWNKRATLPVREAVADGWIPVSERVPDETYAYGCHTDDVLCLTRSGKCVIAMLARTTTGQVWYDQQSQERDVTHWMQLPAAPSPSREGE